MFVRTGCTSGCIADFRQHRIRTNYGQKVEGTRKPYPFAGPYQFILPHFFRMLCSPSAHPRFTSPDTFMSKMVRLYQDTRNVAGGSNLDKLNDELQDVTKIMTKNMEELLWRGDSLDRKFTSASRVPRHLTLSSQGCRTCQHHYGPSLKNTAKRHVTSTSKR